MGRGPGCLAVWWVSRSEQRRPTSRAEWGGARHHPPRVIVTVGVSVWLEPSGPSPSPRRRRYRRRLNSIPCGCGPAVRFSGLSRSELRQSRHWRSGPMAPVDHASFVQGGPITICVPLAHRNLRSSHFRASLHSHAPRGGERWFAVEQKSARKQPRDEA